MKPIEILNCRRLPSRLNAEQVSALVGCNPHDIPALIRAGLLKPLGTPAANSVKWFASCDLEAKVSDPKWCARVTTTIYDFWKSKKSPSTD
jgi:hypothetical protein